jgi:hypothetical protein
MEPLDQNSGKNKATTITIWQELLFYDQPQIMAGHPWVKVGRRGVHYHFCHRWGPGKL